MVQVAEALQIKGFYIESWNVALTGRRFGRIIAFKPNFESRTDQEKFTRWFYEDIRTHLSVNDTDKVYLV